MSPWYEHPADSSRMMIMAYQNDLQMFPIFRMQFSSLNDLCMPAIICCEKIGSESKFFSVRQLRRLFPEPTTGTVLILIQYNAGGGQ